MRLTRAIVEQHSFAIDAYADNTGDTSARAGHLLPQWQADRIALAKQGIDMKWPHPEAPAASWNAGQRLGFDGRVSLAPLLVVQLMVGAWLFAAVMRTRAAVVPLVDLCARDT